MNFPRVNGPGPNSIHFYSYSRATCGPSTTLRNDRGRNAFQNSNISNVRCRIRFNTVGRSANFILFRGLFVRNRLRFQVSIRRGFYRGFCFTFPCNKIRNTRLAISITLLRLIHVRRYCLSCSNTCRRFYHMYSSSSYPRCRGVKATRTFYFFLPP